MALDRSDIGILEEAFSKALGKSGLGSSAGGGSGSLFKGRSGTATDLEDDFEKNKKALRKLEQQLKLLSAESKKYRKDQSEEGKQKRAALIEQRKHVQAEGKALQQKIRAQNEEINTTLHSIKKRQEEQDAIEDNQKQFKEHTKGIIQATLAAYSLKQGLINGMSDLRKSMSVGYDLGVGDYFNMPAELGIGVQEFMDIQKQYRLTAKKLDEDGAGFVETLGTIRDDIFSRVGDSAEATRLAASSMESAMMLGLNVKEASDFVTRDMMPAFKRLNDSVGMTAEEFANVRDAIMTDTEIRATLLGLQKNERTALINSTMGLVEHFRALNYSAEEAGELAKQMAAQQTEDPIERIKSAARMQAMAGAMGMDPNQAARLGELRRTRFEDLTKEQVKELRGLQASMSEQIQMGKTKGMGSEIATSVLESRLLGDMAGAIRQAGEDRMRGEIGTTIEPGEQSGFKELSATLIKGFDSVTAILGGALTATGIGTVLMLTKIYGSVKAMGGAGSVLKLIKDGIMGGGPGKGKGIGSLVSGGGGLKKVGLVAAKTLGKGLLRLIPGVGWALLAFDILSMIWDTFGDDIKETVSKVGDWFSEKTSQFTNFLSDLPSMIFDTMMSNIGDYLSTVTNIGSSLAQGDFASALWELGLGLTPDFLEPIYEKLFPNPSGSVSEDIISKQTPSTSTGTQSSLGDGIAQASLADELGAKQTDLLGRMVSALEENNQMQKDIKESGQVTAKNTRRRAQYNPATMPG